MEFASEFAYVDEEGEAEQLEVIEEAEVESSQLFPPGAFLLQREAIQVSQVEEEVKRPKVSQIKVASPATKKKDVPSFKAPKRKADLPAPQASVPVRSSASSVPQAPPPFAAPKKLIEIANPVPSAGKPQVRPVSERARMPPKPQKCGMPPPKVDTNIVTISLDVISNDSQVATGDPTFCTNCRALLNSHSVISEASAVQEWVCEFCDAHNTLTLDAEEIPRADVLNYILEDPQDAMLIDDDSTVIFCIDISGSMGVTKPASGRIKLKTSRHAELMKLLQPDELDQFFPGQDRNLTYISRLECVQAAIDSQLTAMQTKMPTRKVGLVVFSRDVRIIGDGRTEEVITGDKLESYEQCWNAVEGRLGHFISSSVADCREVLSQKLFALEENGPTALGPALLASIGLACQGKPGSKVIICTDGLANVGLGAFEGCDLEVVQSFYEQLGETAKEHGVSCSVVSIEGEECRLEELSIMVDATEGEITMVDPEHLAENFANILSDQLIASHASATVTMHKALAFRNTEATSLSLGGSQMTRKIGNVNTTTSFSFEYQLKSKAELAGLDLTALASFPFQVAIEYTKPSGQKCILCITKLKQRTSDKREAEAASNFDVLASHAQVKSAALAQKGQWQKAQQSISAWNSVLSRNVRSEKDNEKFHNAAANMGQLSSVLAEQQMEEQEEIDEDDIVAVKRSRAHKMKDKTVSTISSLKRHSKK
jgi:hypothetical protein